jgi:hypothetical protein
LRPFFWLTQITFCRGDGTFALFFQGWFNKQKSIMISSSFMAFVRNKIWSA